MQSKKHKSVESELYVYVDIRGEAVLAGLLTLDDSEESHFYAEFT